MSASSQSDDSSDDDESDADERTRVTVVARVRWRERGEDREEDVASVASRAASAHRAKREAKVIEYRELRRDEREEGDERRGIDVSVSWRARAGAEEEERFERRTRRAFRAKAEVDVEIIVIAPAYVPMMANRGTLETLAMEGDEGKTRFREVGVGVVNERASKEALERAREAATAFIQRIEAHAIQSHAGIRFGVDRFAFREIGSRGGNRFDALVDLESEEWSSVKALSSDAPWMKFVRELMPNGTNVAVSVVYSYPGAKNQEWHADGRHLDRECDVDGVGESPPYALCVFMPLIDLNHEVGFTQFFCKSHKTSKLIGFGEASHELNASFDGVLNAGQAVMYDYRLLHRGMANNSLDTIRPVLQFLYTTPAYRETKNYGIESFWA